ncbi:MAG: peptidoglycan editing factor PgeF [Syntrophothermus sp.]
MIILKSAIFNKYSNVIFGFSTKAGENGAPYYFNVSSSVGDDPENVNANRKKYYEGLGLTNDNICYQKQIHSAVVTYVDKPGHCGESDAMITDKPNLGLAISTADCTPVFVYDKIKKVIAGIHSGWKGTQLNIITAALNELKDKFNSNPEDLIVYIGPSISQEKYEVGKEFTEIFDAKFINEINNKFYLNVSGINYKRILDFGIPKENVQYSTLCSYDLKNLLHSYRRDGLKSGRSFGIIAMKGFNGK